MSKFIIMSFLGKIVVTFIVVLLGAYFMPGIEVSGIVVALITSVVLTFLNSIVKPILKFLSIPITILTLGLFLLVINAGMILLADFLVPGFYVHSFFSALVFGLILSVVTWLFDKDNKQKRRR